MWQSRTKKDFIIEVWEKLDCESVGAKEIRDIEDAVNAHFGEPVSDSPMVVARILVDEGASLRHPEIMKLYLKRKSKKPYDAAFRNLLKLSDFKSALRTIRNLENLRRKFAQDGDKAGLHAVREDALRAKRELLNAAESSQKLNAEIAEWITIWLQSPEIFETWIKLRLDSDDFIKKFGTFQK